MAAIQLRMRMRILTRPENSLANCSNQISNRKFWREAQFTKSTVFGTPRRSSSGQGLPPSLFSTEQKQKLGLSQLRPEGRQGPRNSTPRFSNSGSRKPLPRGHLEPRKGSQGLGGGSSGASERRVRFQRSGERRGATQRPRFPGCRGSNPRVPTLRPQITLRGQRRRFLRAPLIGGTMFSAVPL